VRRALCWLLVGACAARARHPSSVPAGELPTLERAGALYVLVVGERDATCERWTVDQWSGAPSSGSGSWLVRPSVRGAGAHGETVTTQIAYHFAAGRLSIVEVASYYDDDRTHLGGAGCSTAVELDTREDADALVVGGARWFRTAQGCEQARGEHRPVASLHDLGCGVPDVSEAAALATGARFERVLEDGGELFTIVDDGRVASCTSTRVVPRHSHASDVLAGRLVTAAVSDNGARGTITYGYELPRGTNVMDLVGPAVEWEGNEPGGEFACGHQTHVELDADRVVLGHGQPTFFTADRCRAAITDAHTRASWLPPTAGAAGSAHSTAAAGAPMFGGC
jgi:hypothetical protein